MWGTLILLILIVLVFAVLRVVTDAPNILSGTVPQVSSSEYRYARCFGVAFWLGFAMHVVAAELWMRWRPWPGKRFTRLVRTSAGSP